MSHGKIVGLIILLVSHTRVLSHGVVVRGAILLRQLIFAFDARILVNLARLFVFVEDRLCSRIIYTKLICCAPN